MSTRRPDTASLEQESPLLPASPAARVARWTGWLLLAAFSGAIAFAFLVKLPEVVSALFVLEPEGGADPIQAPLAAELATVRVSEGQSVKAGDELFALQSDEIRNWQSRLGQLREDQRSLAERTSKLDEAHTEALLIKDAEIVQATNELSFRQQYLEASKDFLRRAQALADSKSFSEIELIRDQLQVAQAEKDLAVGEKTRQQLVLQRQELETARARERIEEAAQAEKLKMQITALERQLGNCTGDVKSVRAPYDAVVLSLKQRNVGTVVALGAELCQLARADAVPLARLTLPESGMPRLKPGQIVRLRYEAYPYQRYGSIAATLAWISPEAVPGPSGPVFQATCQLPPVLGDSLIKPRVGMRGQARVLLGRRTLFERLLEPLRMIRESANAS
jgi:multidrug efflux pump subunit AcrA (membrane-fusion protein)